MKSQLIALRYHKQNKTEIKSFFKTYESSIRVDFQNVQLSAWKTVWSLTNKLVPLPSGMPIMPPSREGWTFKQLQATSSKVGSWSAGRHDVQQWLQVDLGNQCTLVTGVATQGGNAANQWVTKYSLQYSDDGVIFKYYRDKRHRTNKVRFTVAKYT